MEGTRKVIVRVVEEGLAEIPATLPDDKIVEYLNLKDCWPRDNDIVKIEFIPLPE